jgi:hypothetical protein
MFALRGMPGPMTFFPRLLAILAILMPQGSGEECQPSVPGLAPAPGIVCGQQSVCFVFCPPHLPTPIESFFECLDETAIDEEDSTRVEDHGFAPLSLFGYNSPEASLRFSSLFPAGPHVRTIAVTSVLRC